MLLLRRATAQNHQTICEISFSRTYNILIQEYNITFYVEAERFWAYCIAFL